MRLAGPGPWPPLSLLAFSGSGQEGVGQGAAWQVGQAGSMSGNSSGGNDPDGCVTLGPWTGAGGSGEFCIVPICPRVGPSRTAPRHVLW